MEYNLSRLEWHFIFDYPISIDYIASAITTGTKTKRVQDISEANWFKTLKYVITFLNNLIS